MRASYAQKQTKTGTAAGIQAKKTTKHKTVMKTNFKITALACLMFFGMANAFAQGGADRNPGTFSKIKITGSTTVEIVQGPVSGIHIEGPAELVEKVKTELNNDELLIKDGDDSKVKIIVTVPTLTAIQASGGVNVKSQGKIAGDKLRIDVSGAVDVELDVDITTIDVHETGACDVKLTGKTQDLNAEISGASDLKAYGLEADNVTLNVSGTSDANVNVKTTINANASGASDVRYVGTPVNKTLNKSGTSDVRHKDDASRDTTRVGMGKKKYTIISDNNDDVDDDDFNIRNRDKFHFWQGLDIHMNAILDNKNNADPLPGYEFMELNYPRSIGVSWNMIQKNIHVYKNYVNLVTGFGIDWSVYGFRNNTTLRHDTSFLAATFDTVDYKRNRLRAFYVQVPLMLEFNTHANENRSFHIAAGVLLGYNVFDNKLKQKYELDGKDYKNVVRDDFNINPVRYGLTGRVGYGDYSIFANYNVSTLFEKDAGPKMYPVQVGFHIDF